MRRYIKDNDALSPVLSAVIALLIFSSTVLSVVIWGGPYIDELNSKTSKENANQQLVSIADAINDLANSNPGDTRIDTFNVGKGDFSAGNGGCDSARTVITYSYDQNYSFTTDGLDTCESDTCFLVGTKVLMDDGSYKSIEDIRVGEMVLSFDTQNEQFVSCKVINVFHHSPSEMTDYYLVINNGLKVTPNHRFYSGDKWVYADDLKIGDPLFTTNKDSNYQIYSINRIYEKKPSYDLEIEQCHNYFVSAPSDGVDILVHNGGTSQQTTLYPSADSYIAQANSGGNYGNYAYMWVDPGAGQRNRMLLQFNLSSIPIHSTINSAKLWIDYYAKSGLGNPAGHTHECHMITGPWTGSGVTWSNQPSYDPSYYPATVPGSFNWMNWTITSSVQSFVDGTYTNYGWLIKDSLDPVSILIGGTALSYATQFYSNESGSNRPYLVIDYTPSRTITFYTNPTTGGTITFDGGSYSNGTQEHRVNGNYGISANPATNYVFNNWSSSGSISIANQYSQSTTATISGDGSITAYFVVPALAAEAAGPYYGYVGTSLQFSGSAVGGSSPYTYSWDFDNSNGIQVDNTSQNPTHIYTVPGAYTATLTVTDSLSNKDSDTATATIILLPSADSFISQYNHGTKYGAQPYMWVDPGATQRNRMLLQFDLSSIPSGSTVLYANLSIYYYAKSGQDPTGRTHECHMIKIPWAEGSVNWDNQPSYYSSNYSATVPSPFGWMTWNVVNDVQNFVDGVYTNNGWLIKDSGDPEDNDHGGTVFSYAAQFYSKDYGSISYRPRLEIYYIKCQTLSATGVEKTNATFSGKVLNDGNGTCQYEFAYRQYPWGTDTVTGWNGSVRSGDIFSLNKSLSIGSYYRYQVCIKPTSGIKTNVGDYTYFLTKPDDLSNFNATISSFDLINLSWTNGAGGDGAYIEYTTGAPPSPWNPDLINHSKVDADGYVAGTFFQHTNLSNGTKYYYKAWAYADDDNNKSDGTVAKPFGNSQISNATTPAEPSIITNDATNVLNSIATLNGQLQDSGGLNCTVWFQYGTTPNYGTNTTPQSKNSTTAFTATLTDLSNGTTYYFRAVGKLNVTGYEFHGAQKNFTTRVEGIVVDSPAYGYNWKRGTTQTIEWRYGIEVFGSLNITLQKGAEEWIINNTASLGEQGFGAYNWSIPPNQTIGNFKYRIKIASNADPTLCNYSNYFSIIELHEGIIENTTAAVFSIGGGLYNVTVPGDNFTLHMFKGIVTRAEVYWLEYGKEPATPPTFSGAVCVDLYNGSNMFGSVYILDSDSLSYICSSSSGYNCKLTIENGGIVYSDLTGENYVQEAPPQVYAGTNTNIFSVHVIQLVASPFAASGTDLKVKMKTNLTINSNREKQNNPVYNFRMQFYGNNDEAWLNYFDTHYNFVAESNNTLYYTPSASAIKLSFAHSAIGVSIN